MLAGKTNLAAFAVGAGVLVAILLLKRWPRIPSVLIAVATVFIQERAELWLELAGAALALVVVISLTK